MTTLIDGLKRPYHRVREIRRLRALDTWSSRLAERARPRTDRIGLLAGFGNTSYGDTFIGLGVGAVARAVGAVPVLIGRSHHRAAFDAAGIDFTALPDRANGLEEFEAAMGSLSALVLAGGGIFEDHTDAVLSQSLAAGYAARLVAASRLGLATAVHAVGLGTEPFLLPGTEHLVGRALTTARTVGLRDARGVEAARSRFEITARLVTDPAVIPLADRQSEARGDNGRAAFLPFGRLAWPFMDRPDEAAFARQQPDWDAAAERLARFDEVVVVPFHSSDVNFLDRIAGTIARRSPGTTVTVAPFRPEDPLSVMDVLAQCGSAVTMRYHGFVACWFAGIRDITTIGSSHKLTVTADLHRKGELEALWSAEKARRQFEETLDVILG